MPTEKDNCQSGYQPDEIWHLYLLFKDGSALSAWRLVDGTLLDVSDATWQKSDMRPETIADLERLAFPVDWTNVIDGGEGVTIPLPAQSLFAPASTPHLQAQARRHKLLQKGYLAYCDDPHGEYVAYTPTLKDGTLVEKDSRGHSIVEIITGL